MEPGAIVAIVIACVFLLAFAFVMFKIYSGNKKKEFEKNTSVKGGIEKNAIENRKIEILSSIDPNDPEDAKKKLEVVKELEKLHKGK